MKEETHSIADARNHLPELVHRAEEHTPVILTRRGQPVAVMVAYDDYRSKAAVPSFYDSLCEFREKHIDATDDLSSAFDNLRDTTTGRDPFL